MCPQEYRIFNSGIYKINGIPWKPVEHKLCATYLLNLDLRSLGNSQPHIAPVPNTTLDHKLRHRLILDSLGFIAPEELD
jgi:hypothetical protein